jgi:AP-3 complex subunit delta-1
MLPVKYLGLLAMSKILQTHPKSVQTHKDLILQCLDDKDESIRFRALDLLYGMVSDQGSYFIICIHGIFFKLGFYAHYLID